MKEVKKDVVEKEIVAKALLKTGRDLSQFLLFIERDLLKKLKNDDEELVRVIVSLFMNAFSELSGVSDVVEKLMDEEIARMEGEENENKRKDA
jgi:hypothetical protein